VTRWPARLSCREHLAVRAGKYKTALRGFLHLGIPEVCAHYAFRRVRIAIQQHMSYFLGEYAGEQSSEVDQATAILQRAQRIFRRWTAAAGIWS
jgi:hypothetical protein